MINGSQLPEAEGLNIAALSQLFAKTTNSYKFVFFLSLLDILNRRHFECSEAVTFQELVIEMLANVWYPHIFFKLSFGSQDKLAQKLDSLNLEAEDSKLKSIDKEKKSLRKLIANQLISDIVPFISRYVPFRLLTVFFRDQLVGVDSNHEVDQRIPALASELFNTQKPLYRFDSEVYRDCTSLLIHPDWAAYIKTHYMILRGWAAWEWLEYMQKRNPSVPAISSKLFPPQERASLAEQTKYWKTVLNSTDLTCIYSGIPIRKEQMSLDHYIPWTFVAHDQLWNLIPTLPQINSSKSNNLPSDIYFDSFVAMQHKGLTTSQKVLSERIWRKYTDAYIADLKISSWADLLEIETLRAAYLNNFQPLLSLASSQGFSSNWTF